MKKINKQKKAIPPKVTEHRKIMKKLRENKKLFHKIFEEGPIGMAIIGKDYRLLDVNNKFCQMVGYTKNELTKLTFVDITHPEDIDKDTRLAEKVFKEEIPFYRMEKRYIKKNRKIIWINLTASVIRDKKKKSIYGLAMVEEITERKKTEEALRKSEERFRQIAENSQGWIWEVDTNGLYTYVSPVVEKMLGYKPREIVGKKHFYDFFHPDDRKEMKKAAFEAFAKKASFREFLNRNIHKNGKKVWLSTSGVPILDKKGNLLGYRGADTDITERKNAEEELMRLVSKLKQKKL